MAQQQFVYDEELIDPDTGISRSPTMQQAPPPPKEQPSAFISDPKLREKSYRQQLRQMLEDVNPMDWLSDKPQAGAVMMGGVKLGLPYIYQEKDWKYKKGGKTMYDDPDIEAFRKRTPLEQKVATFVGTTEMLTNNALVSAALKLAYPIAKAGLVATGRLLTKSEAKQTAMGAMRIAKASINKARTMIRKSDYAEKGTLLKRLLDKEKEVIEKIKYIAKDPAEIEKAKKAAEELVDSSRPVEEIIGSTRPLSAPRSPIAPKAESIVSDIEASGGMPKVQPNIIAPEPVAAPSTVYTPPQNTVAAPIQQQRNVAMEQLRMNRIAEMLKTGR